MAEWLHQHVVSPLMDPGLIWFVALWAVLAAVAAIETIAPARDDPDRDRRWPTNLGIGIAAMMVTPLAPVTVVVASEWAHAHNVGLLNRIQIPWWIAAAATVALRSLASYVLHVILHQTPVGWRIHRVHHLDTRLDVTTAVRSHPVEAAVAIAFTVPLAIALGFDPVAVFAFEVFDGLLNLATHANLRLPETVDRAIRWCLVTPNVHSLHHSSDRRETDSNYGGVFTIWDRLFGTFRSAPLAGPERMRIGLEEVRDARAHEFWWQMRSPLVRLPRADESPRDPADQRA
jgi:sterol desaturase/sphingolipid hydroxylase (fatty acid hydroxylase superfamily)